MSDTSGNAAPSIQAILLAASVSDAFGPIIEHTPVEMMPLANQPLIGRMVGWLVGLGVKDITVLATHRDDLLASYLGDGVRWGARIRVVAVASVMHMFARLPELAVSDFVLTGPASTLPFFEKELLRVVVTEGGGRFVSASGEPLHWSCMRRSFHGVGVRECRGFSEFDQRVTQAGAKDVLTASSAMRCDTPAELLQSSRAMLSGLRPDQIIPGACAEKGVYISRNVVLHPTVRVTPPVVIGADCNIGRGARIGPYAVIGDKCILDAHTTLEDGIVFPGTYIGSHLELAAVVVDHNSLAYANSVGAVPVPDQFMLSGSEGEAFGSALRRFSRRVAAVALLVPLSVVILILYLLGRAMGVGKPLRRTESVLLPAAADPALWATFNYVEFDAAGPGTWRRIVRALRAVRLPTLWNLACGEVAWVGLRPLTAAEMKALPSDWRQLYGSGKVGIVRLAEIDRTFEGDDPNDQIYSSEAYYVSTHSFKSDLAIFWRSIWARTQ